MENKPLGLVFLPAQKGLPGLEDRHLTVLREQASRLRWEICGDEQAFQAALPDAAAALAWRFPAEWRTMAAKLRLLATPAAGRDWVKVAPEPGLKLWFGSFHGELMAETVLGLMLAFVRGIRDGLLRQDRESWPREAVGSRMRPLRGSRAVIVGFGNIGKWIARLLTPLGVMVVGVNRSDLRRPDFLAPEAEVIPLERLDQALPACDHLICALPGGPGSDGVIDARRLALLPASAHVYNVGRGNAIDMAALVAALREEKLAGAGLDVFDREPLPADHPIRSCPNTILLPHVSAFADNYFDLFLRDLLPEIGDLFPAGGEAVVSDR